MGLLTFLQRRQSNKSTLASAPSTLSASTCSHNNGSAVYMKSQDTGSLNRRYHSTDEIGAMAHRSATVTSNASPSIYTEASSSTRRPGTAPYGDGTTTNSSSGSIPFSNAAKRLSLSSSYADLPARSESVDPGAARGYVDLLDARGQIGPSDFRERVKASGSRDYGEDVAERNIGQNGLLLGSPAVQEYYATRPATALRRQNTMPSRQRTQYTVQDAIPEHPETGQMMPRPSSRASSIRTARSLPVTRLRVSPVHEFNTTAETYQPGHIRWAPAPAAVPSIGQPKLEAREQHPHKDDQVAEYSDDAFPPSIPRYRRVELDDAVATLERPLSTLGSVRRARQSIYSARDLTSRTSLNGVLEEEPVSPTTKHPRPTSRASSRASQQNLSLENINRWKQSLDLVEEDSASVVTERAVDSRASRRQWSIASTEPTEPSEAASSIFNARPGSRCTANTSILMELDESNSAKTRTSCDAARDDDDEEENDNEMETCSITTDGSNIDAFMEKRRRRASPEDETLLFNEAGFFGGGGGALPGLYDLFQILPARTAPQEPQQPQQTQQTETIQERPQDVPLQMSPRPSSALSAIQTVFSAPPSSVPASSAFPVRPQQHDHELPLEPVPKLIRNAKVPEASESPATAPSSARGRLLRRESNRSVRTTTERTLGDEQTPSCDRGASHSSQERELERQLQPQLEIEVAGDTAPEEDRCSSVATPESVPGSFVPKMYLTQRQRLLALGFDYDSDDEELAALSSDVEEEEPATLKAMNVAGLGPERLSIVIESPSKTDARIASEAAQRRKEAKRVSRVGTPRAKLRKVVEIPVFEDNDGNLADVE